MCKKQTKKPSCANEAALSGVSSTHTTSFFLRKHHNWDFFFFFASATCYKQPEREEKWDPWTEPAEHRVSKTVRFHQAFRSFELDQENMKYAK